MRLFASTGLMFQLVGQGERISIREKPPVLHLVFEALHNVALGFVDFFHIKQRAAGGKLKIVLAERLQKVAGPAVEKRVSAGGGAGGFLADERGAGGELAAGHAENAVVDDYHRHGHIAQADVGGFGDANGVACAVTGVDKHQVIGAGSLQAGSHGGQAAVGPRDAVEIQTVQRPEAAGDIRAVYPDLIEERYGTGARILSTITTILAYIGHTAGQLIAAGSILHVVTGWDSGICFVVAAAITVLYTTIGGYFAVTNTDLLQVALLIVGVSFFGVIFSGKALDTAGLSLMSLPESYFDISAWGWPTIIAMSISIIFSFYTCMDSYTRCYAARDTKTAKNGALLALVGVLLIAGASTYLGMVAKVILPDLASSSDSAASLILATFPRGVCGLVMAGILAAIMSTGDICILTVSANVTQDIYHRFINPKASDKRLLRIGMLVSLVVGILSTIFAWFMGDVMDTLLIAFTVNSAGLFLPTVCGFIWKKANAKAAVVSISASLVVVLFWFALGQLGVGGIFAIDPLWPGLIASAVTFFPLCLFSEPTQSDAERCERFMAASAENS